MEASLAPLANAHPIGRRYATLCSRHTRPWDKSHGYRRNVATRQLLITSIGLHREADLCSTTSPNGRVKSERYRPHRECLAFPAPNLLQRSAENPGANGTNKVHNLPAGAGASRVASRPVCQFQNTFLVSHGFRDGL